MTTYPTWVRWLSQTTLLLLCLWSMSPHSLRAQDALPTRTLADYQTQLLGWQRRLAQPDGATHLQTVQQAMAAIQQIELPTGDVIAIQPLLHDLPDGPNKLVTAQRRLAILIDELTAAGADDTVARSALLTTIFQRTEFVTRDSLWDRVWRWLRARLPDLPNGENSTGAITPLFQWLGWILIAVGALLLIGLLSYWLQSLLGTFIRNAERRSGGANGEIPQTAAAARHVAHRLADAGSYREAVRQLYLSALLTLYERNLISYHPSDTNREVLTAIHDQPQLHQQLQPIVQTFDDVWYGVHEPDRTSFDRYAAAVEKLEEAQS